MIVVDHRPPLRRIEIGARPQPAPAPPEIDLDCIAKFMEQERVWKLVQQAAQGQGSVEE
ncbi:hypothetical protein [Bradyrhizobium sp. Arg816]|uniref:hypothetical protein n=1 Tax=Bradyrhizobium sp. Arg816 TaxID=2998491 RepID=UPI00249F1634|nr:hypothetical protein [Bradyrhizobium sp. Arg816]MDI3563543.1 hypothetical protein [Bradyrhizobium sp. Arg816]